MIIYDINGRPMRRAEYSEPKLKLAYAQPNASDLRPVDPVMTNLSIGFKQDRYIWDKVAPTAEVDQPSGTFFKYDREFWFRVPLGGDRAPEGPYLRTGYGVSTDTYTVSEKGYEKLLGDVTRAASQTPEDLQDRDVAFLTNIMELVLEEAIANECFVTGKWGTSQTAVNKWDDFATADPIYDSDKAKETIRRATGAEPNALIIGRSAWDVLKENPIILDKYKHTQTGIMTESLVAAALGITELIVGNAIKDDGLEGAGFSANDIWGDNALYLVRNQPGLMVAAGAFTYMWNEQGNVPWGVQTYRIDERRSDVTRIFSHFVPKIVSNQHGYFLGDLLA